MRTEVTPAGNATAQVVTNSNVTGAVSDTTMSYDDLGRTLSKVENANTFAPQTTSYTYTAAGQQLSMTQPAGSGTATTTMTYDALGRTLTTTAPSGVTTMTYDADGHTLSSATSAGTTSDRYDPLGRALTETKTDGSGVTQTPVANGYDLDGNLITTATSYASAPSVVVTRTYDALDRLHTLSDGQRVYTYDSTGNVTAMTASVSSTGPTVTSASYVYDGGSRLLTQGETAGPSGVQLHSETYHYNQAGDRASLSADGASTTYSYDDAHQLLSETSGGAATTSYTYDGYTNRTAMVTATGTTSYSYDPITHSELTQKTDPDGKLTTYSYDASGALRSATYDPTGLNQVTGYTYDTSNRLASVSKPDGTVVAFGYDATGQRTSVSVTPSGGSASVVKDYYQLGQLAYQTDGTGALLASYTDDSNGTPVSVAVGPDPTNQTSTPRYWYVYNAHGDVVNLVDASGNVVATYAYDTWGNPTSASEAIPNANGWVNPYRYDGRDGVRYDAADGLYWMAVRAYDPTIGRFISRDPLGRAPLFLASGDNPYGYAGNNPVSNVDPSGQRYVVSHSGGESQPAHLAPKKTRVKA